MPQGGGPEENTAAMVRAMDNCPKICILGHPDDGRYPLDYPALVRAAGERGVLLEVNNTSLSPACSRVNSTANVTEMLKHCRREGVPVVVGSDAHFVSAVGGHQYAQALLDELDFPEELVLNREPAAFLAHLEDVYKRQGHVPDDYLRDVITEDHWIPFFREDYATGRCRGLLLCDGRCV